MKKKNPFSSMQDAAVGIAGLGVTTGVVAGISAKTPAGFTNMSQSMNTLSGFAPVAAIGVGAKSALSAMPKAKKKYRW